jgi:hypothetical protein
MTRHPKKPLGARLDGAAIGIGETERRLELHVRTFVGSGGWPAFTIDLDNTP